MIIRKGCIKNAIKKIHIKRLKKCDKKNYKKQSYKKLPVLFQTMHAYRYLFL